MSGGVNVRLPDTLLSDRAADFLAAGPADAVTLVRHICGMPNASPGQADQIARSLLGERGEFARGADGRWRLAAHPEPAPAPAAAAPPPATIPSFDEWRRQRDAERAAAPPTPEPVVTGRTRVGTPITRRSAAPPVPAEALPGSDEPLLGLSYAVVDVETTGGSPLSGHRITEIAVVRVAGGEVREVYETLVNPRRPIPPQIMKLTGITMEMVRDKPMFRDVCPDVVDALKGHVFVAHNVTFDWRFVSHEVEWASGLGLDGRKLCTVRLSRKLLPQLRSRSLGFVADHYGADQFAESYFERAYAERRHAPTRHWRHSAAGDAVATAHCMLRLFHDAADRGITTWGQLQELIGTSSARGRRRRSAMPGAVDRDTTA